MIDIDRQQKELYTDKTFTVITVDGMKMKIFMNE
jgi:hypothetical protein